MDETNFGYWALGVAIGLFALGLSISWPRRGRSCGLGLLALYLLGLGIALAVVLWVLLR